MATVICACQTEREPHRASPRGLNSPRALGSIKRQCEREESLEGVVLCVFERFLNLYPLILAAAL